MLQSSLFDGWTIIFDAEIWWSPSIFDGFTATSRRSHWFTADITSAKRFSDSCKATERSGAGSFLPDPAGTRSTNKERTVENGKKVNFAKA